MVSLIDALRLLAFLIGFGLIPFVAWTFGPALPYFIAEPFGNLLFMLSNLGVRVGVLEQKETDEYVIEREDDELTPRSYWSRWATARLGITFEATEEAFEPMLADEDHARELEHLEYDGQGIATVDMARGEDSTTWFATKSDVGKLLVPIGQKLSRLSDVAGPDMGTHAYAEALGDYGGDTSEFGTKFMVGGTVVMFFGTAMMGYVIFF